MDSDDSDPLYDVEKILRKRINKDGEVEFYVKWVGYKTGTWEPRSNLIHCEEMLKKFEKNEVATPKKGQYPGPKTPRKIREKATPRRGKTTPRAESTPKKQKSAEECVKIDSVVWSEGVNRRASKRVLDLEMPVPSEPVVVSYVEEQESPSRSVSPERSSPDSSVEPSLPKRAKQGSPDIPKMEESESLETPTRGRVNRCTLQ